MRAPAWEVLSAGHRPSRPAWGATRELRLGSGHNLKGLALLAPPRLTSVSPASGVGRLGHEYESLGGYLNPGEGMLSLQHSLSLYTFRLGLGARLAMPRAAGGNPAGLLRSCEGPLVVWAPPPQHPRGAAAMQPCWFRSLFVLVRRSSSLSRPKMWTEPACRRTIPRRERHRVLPIALSPLQEGRCYPSPAYRRNGRPEKGRGVRQGQVMAEMASAGFQTHKKHRFFLCVRQGHRLPV